ncbi:MFS family permease [Streptosporangium album]|uniref:MFS family permease n=1 Tax=Streptosporangium album TaxID=47479 RepID=A0A7W7RSW3_9ACTN|nr:MFS transporter [Streptosporangium album]MBB4937554.1 MFS family permease [Streptosporangium album]
MRRWWALAALVLSVLVIGPDATVLNVALPTLAVELGATTSDLQWVMDAYLIPFAALMLPAGAFGDRFGRKRLLLAGERLLKGSGTLQTLRQIGGAFGVAGLGSLLSAVYVGGLPAGVPEAAKDSVAAAVRLGDTELTASAGQAYTLAMDTVLGTCAALVLVSAVLVAVFMRVAEPRESAHELTSAP